MIAKLPKKYQQIASDIFEAAKKNGVKIKTSKKDTLPYPIGDMGAVHGFFVINGKYPKGELGIALGDGPKETIKTLIHESCHMDQFVSGEYAWSDTFLYDCKDNKIKESVDLIDEWINGRELSDSVLNDVINCSLNVELDCERRSAEKIKKYNLDIDIEEYTQQANSYIYFYRFIKETRAWYKKTPYQVKKVWSIMPKTFNNDYSFVPEEYKKAYRKLL